MKRFAPLSIHEIESRLIVDCVMGRCYWRKAPKHHAELHGKEAGYARKATKGGAYWVIKINGIPYKRAQIILAVVSGRWPDQIVDHRNGETLDDRADNLRHATVTQNNWNHRNRSEQAQLPMGIRILPSGRFQARIACDKRKISIGTFETIKAAHAAYLTKRKELFHEYSGT